jgi:hypothetical protein
MWSTVFATQEDRRSFVEMCLERSQAVDLDVTVDASKLGWTHPGCTCDKDEQRRLLPNEKIPCEWHFTFESFAALKHSKRIRTLDIDFHDTNNPIPHAKRTELVLGGCRLFSLSFPQLTILGWNCVETNHVNHIFSISPFAPTLHSLSFKGDWSGPFTQLSNLTSFTFLNNKTRISEDAFRLFMLNNQFLESLSLDILDFHPSDLEAPPVQLLNIKSFSIYSCPGIMSGIICIPALQHLSSLCISLNMASGFGDIILDAIGDGISLSVKTSICDTADAWEDITGYARPIIRHARLWGYPKDPEDARHCYGREVLPLLVDVHTLEVGRGYLPFFYSGFLDDLKQLGPQLKTIRFEVWEEMEPSAESGDEYERWWGRRLDEIVDLVKCRFEQGRPFSAVERMVVSESERSNRLQDHVWRCFYRSRNLGQYIQPA